VVGEVFDVVVDLRGVADVGRSVATLSAQTADAVGAAGFRARLPDHVRHAESLQDDGLLVSGTAHAPLNDPARHRVAAFRRPDAAAKDAAGTPLAAQKYP
jgi:hypothetical protein